MEWNYYWNENDVTHFSLFESTGDSEEVKSDVKSDVYNPHYGNYGHAQEEVAKHVYEQDVSSFRYKEGEYNKYNDNENDKDDDAQSCSYDHSSYMNMNTSYSNSHHDESQRLVYGANDDNNGGDVVDHHDDDEHNNWCESKMIDPSHNFCVDPSNDQREIDRRFWESCFNT